MFNLFPEKLIKIFPELYAVGGCVRDYILKISPQDIDYTTCLLPEEIIARAKKAGFSVVLTGVAHGTVTVIVDNVSYEITTFRKDNDCDGRKATVEFCDSLMDDLNRRDFTINAIAKNPSGRLYYPESALQDLWVGKIKTVGDPYERFAEDHLRIIRMARFAARFEFDIDLLTLQAAIHMSPRVLRHVSPERIFMEFNKAFKHNNAGMFLKILQTIGLFTLIFPEFEGFDVTEQDPVYHPEGVVANHIYEVVERADPLYRWHAMLHDVGKAQTFESYSTFHGHDALGAEMINGIADRLKFPNSLRDSVIGTTKYHMYPTMMSANGITPKVCRRFQSKVSPHLEALKAVVMADKGDRFCEVQPLFSPLPVNTTIVPVLLGRHLLEKGIAPGKEMGEMLKKAYAYQIEEGVCDVAVLLKIAIGEL